MKNVAIIIVSVLMWTAALSIVMTMLGRMNRSMELQSSLPSIVEETVANMTVDKKYEINNTNEFIADLVANLSIRLDTDSAIMVEITGKDMKKGLLAVRVTENFKHPNGKKGTVKCERTVILNRLRE